jgi:hypothetical protein
VFWKSLLPSSSVYLYIWHNLDFSFVKRQFKMNVRIKDMKFYVAVEI